MNRNRFYAISQTANFAPPLSADCRMHASRSLLRGSLMGYTGNTRAIFFGSLPGHLHRCGSGGQSGKGKRAFCDPQQGSNAYFWTRAEQNRTWHERELEAEGSGQAQFPRVPSCSLVFPRVPSCSLVFPRVPSCSLVFPRVPSPPPPPSSTRNARNARHPETA